MKKKILSLFVVLTMFAAMCNIGGMSVFAASTTSGKCGDKVTWSLNKSTGVLTISGSGKMWDYEDEDDLDWDNLYDWNDFYTQYQNLNFNPWADGEFVEGRGDSLVKKVVINKGVTSIGKSAFYGCVNLKSVTIPNSVTSIGEDAFYCCFDLSDIKIPSSVTSIGDGAFCECYSLSDVVIPDSITSIGFFVFAGSEMNSLTIPKSVKFIDDSAFYMCWINDIYYLGTEEEWNKITILGYNDGIEDAEIHYQSSTTKQELKITTQPTDFIGKVGSTASFKVVAQGDGLTYQWQLSDDAGKTWRDSSTKIANYSTTLTETNNGRYVRCIVTDKYGNSVTSDSASMKIPGPVITSHPVSVTAKNGDSVKFTVTATGDGLTYQWQLSDDAGKTWRNSSVKTADYYTTLSSTNDGRHIRCIVTDKDGNSATSNAASMKIATLKITTHPTNATAKSGSTVSFKVVASGEGLSYQWQLSDDQGKTWRNSSVKTANYSTTLSSTNNGRYVRCIVTDKYGNKVTSNSASMKIASASAALKITTQPTNATAKSGGTVSFKVVASGEGLSYQWQLSDDQGKTWRNSSVKTANYSTTLSSTNNGRYVRCIITDKYGNKVTSNSASMKIATLKITTQPTNATAKNGGTVSFKVVASGEGLSYQWQLSDDQGKTWRNSSVKTANYSTTLSSTNNGRYVRCIVTDKYGNKVTSNAASMKIK